MGALEIRGGRVVAVDTDTLRHAAAQADLAMTDAGAIRAALRRADDLLFAFTMGGSIAHLIGSAEAVCELGTALVGALRNTASAYEVVELEARRAAAVAAGDPAAAALIGGRIDRLEASSPAVSEIAAAALRDAPDPFATVGWQFTLGTLSNPGLTLVGLVAGAWLTSELSERGHGRLPGHSRLQGPPPPTAVTLLGTSAGSAPGSVGTVAQRIPGEGPGGIRIERYRMRSGEQRFAVYLSGTKLGKDAGAFGWSSNMPLYTGRSAAAYEGARIALARAGAKPGDSVIMSGHSQGAMVASRLALEEDYDVPLLVGFGNPVQADLGPRTLQVDVRHSDDPVSTLAVGGHDASIGAPGSFVAERNNDPWPTLGDIAIQSHHQDAYIESAQMLDASSDPRMDAVRGTLAELGEAESVDVLVFDAAERVTASSADGG